MIFAVLFVELDDGRVQGHCETLPDWPGVVADDYREGLRTARESIAAHITAGVIVYGYKLPARHSEGAAA